MVTSLANRTLLSVQHRRPSPFLRTMTTPEHDPVLYIRFLTSFLHGLELGGDIADATWRATMDSTVTSCKLTAPFAHLATMLNLGDPKVTMGAVTGCADLERGAHAVVVVSPQVSEPPSSAAPPLPEDRPGLAVQNVTRSALMASQVRAERV